MALKGYRIQQSTELGIRELIGILLQHWILIASTTSVMIVLGIGYVFLITHVYEWKASVQINIAGSLLQKIDPNNDENSQKILAAELSKQFESQELLERAHEVAVSAGNSPSSSFKISPQQIVVSVEEYSTWDNQVFNLAVQGPGELDGEAFIRAMVDAYVKHASKEDIDAKVSGVTFFEARLPILRDKKEQAQNAL